MWIFSGHAAALVMYGCVRGEDFRKKFSFLYLKSNQFNNLFLKKEIKIFLNIYLSMAHQWMHNA